MVTCIAASYKSGHHSQPRARSHGADPQFELWGDLHKEFAMLRMALIFFIVALIAAVLGFSGIAIAAAGIAKILFYIFLLLFLVSLLRHLGRRT